MVKIEITMAATSLRLRLKSACVTTGLNLFKNKVPSTRLGTRLLSTEYLRRGGGVSLAYNAIPATGDPLLPGIIFCPGFQSNMQGVKATALENFCKQKGLAYVRFDYRGCGDSTGDLRNATITDWKDDLVAVIDILSAGPQILVGSSIGGWLMMLAALARPFRIHSLIGVATAADFAERGYSSYPPDVRKKVEEEGIALYVDPADQSSYVITKRLLEDSKQYNLLDKPDGIPISCPVHLLHGLDDIVVPYETSLRVARQLWSRDVHVVMRKNADHRFSQPYDVQMIFSSLNYLVFGREEERKLALKSWAGFTVYSHPETVMPLKK